jgi:hypothetical protein
MRFFIPSYSLFQTDSEIGLGGKAEFLGATNVKTATELTIRSFSIPDTPTTETNLI